MPGLLMHRYDDSPSGLVGLQTIVAVIAAVVSLAAAVGSTVVTNRESTGRINVHAASFTRLTAEVDSLRSRVLQLERPNEPVYLPRNPGRIGGKPVIPWIEPWSGSAGNPDQSIGSSSPVGTSIDRQ